MASLSFCWAFWVINFSSSESFTAGFSRASSLKAVSGRSRLALSVFQLWLRLQMYFHVWSYCWHGMGFDQSRFGSSSTEYPGDWGLGSSFLIKDRHPGLNLFSDFRRGGTHTSQTTFRWSPSEVSSAMVVASLPPDGVVVFIIRKSDGRLGI